jgi:hypothetical protein
MKTSLFNESIRLDDLPKVKCSYNTEANFSVNNLHEAKFLN